MRKILTLSIALILVAGIVSVAKSADIDSSANFYGTHWPKDRHIVKSSNGTIVVIYNKSDDIVAKKSADGGDTWTKLDGTAGYTIIDYSDGYASNYVSICLDSSDHIYMAYYAINDIYFNKLSYSVSGSTWTVGTRQTVDNNSHDCENPSITRESGGKVWIAYGCEATEGNGRLRAAYATDPYSSWTYTDIVSATSGPEATQFQPALVIRNSYPFVVFNDQRSGQLNMKSSAWNGSSWSSPITAAATDSTDCGFSITTIGSDVHLVYDEDSGSIYHRYYNGSWNDGGTLSTVVNDGCVNLTTDSTDLWCFISSNVATSPQFQYNIRYKKRSGGTWDTYWTAITTDSVNNLYPTTPLSTTEYIPLAWTVGTSPYPVKFNASVTLASTYTWTGAVSGVWANASNWTGGGGGYPDDKNDKAYINTGSQTITTPASALTIGELVLDSGYSGILTLGAAFTLDASGPWDGNLTISNANAKLYLVEYNLTIQGTFSNIGTLRLRGGQTLSFTNDINSGTVEYVGDGDAAVDTYTIKDFGGTDYYNLTINSTDGTKDVFRLGAGLAMDGTLTVTKGVLYLNGYNISDAAGGASAVRGNIADIIRLRGNESVFWTANDTDSGTYEYVGDGDAVEETFTIKDFGGTDYYNLTISSTTGVTDTFKPSTANLAVAGNFTLTAGTFTTNDGTTDRNLSVTVNVDIDGTFNANSSTITVSGNWDSSGGTFNWGTSTIDLTGTGNFKTAYAYISNLKCAAANKTTTLQSDILLTDTLTLGSGTLTDGDGSTYGVTMVKSSGTPLINGGATVTLASIQYNVTDGTITVAGGNYGINYLNLYANSSNVTFNLGSDIDITITANGVFYLYAVNGATNVVCNTQNNKLTAGYLAFGVETVNGSTTLNCGSSIINMGTGGVNIDTAGGSHTLNLNSATVTCEGNWELVDGTGTITQNPGTSTVTFDNATSTSTLTGSATFYVLVSTASTKNVKVSSNTVIGVTNHLNFENITLRSTSGGATWYLNLSGSATQDVSGVDVRDSNASGGNAIIDFNCPDIQSCYYGNNTKWDFGAPGAITDLTGLCDSGTGYVTLSWSTPGDDEWTGTLVDESKYRIDYSTYVIAWSTGTWDVDISTSGVTPHTQVSHTFTSLTGGSTYYFRIWTADEIPLWSGISNGCTVWVSVVVSSVTVSAYTEGDPDVPPIYTQSSGNCLGTFRFNGGGTITQLTITEYGTCDAEDDLENIKLFKDNGNGDWNSGDDATQLGTTTDFNASDKATFSGFSLVASTYCYVHVVLDVKSTADSGGTVGIELYQDDIVCTSTTTAASWPVQLETSMIIGESTSPSFNDSSFRSQKSNDVWIPTSDWNDDLTPNTRVQVQDTGAGLRIGSQEVAPDTHTVLLMHLNNDTTDYSGHGNNGIKYGEFGWISTDTWRTGVGTEDILYFDGQDDYVDCGDINAIDVATQLSGTAWVKAVTLTDDDVIFGKTAFGSPAEFMFWRDDVGSASGRTDIIAIYFRDSSAKVIRVEGATNSGGDTNWHFVAFTYIQGSSTGLRLYIDGTEDPNSPVSTIGFGSHASTYNFRIGGPTTITGKNFKGLIDEVRIVDRVLTADEIAADYYSGLFKYSKDGGINWYSMSGSTVAWSTGTVTGGNGSIIYETIHASDVPFNQYSETQNKVKFLINDTNGNIAVSSEYIVKIGSITVSAYTDGNPDVPPSTVGQGTTGNCLGTFRFNGTGTISSMTITEYGTCDAEGELENVKLFKDNGNGNWNSGDDATQLGSTTTFNASHKATFSSLSLQAGSTTYVHVILDVKSSAQVDNTIGIELYQNDIVCTSTTTAASWPVQLGTSTIKDLTAPAAITDLTGLCDSGTGYVTLSWSTPGDDGWNNTLVDGSKYRIDYSTYSIAWSTSTFDVDIPTHSVTPYTPVSHTITSLTGGSTYYFRIWTADEIPNWSGLSNGATVWVTVVGAKTYTWTDGAEDGDWTNSNNWSGGGGGYPDDADDKAVINTSTRTINTPASALTIGELALGGSYSGTLTLGNNLTLDDSGEWNGNLTIGAGTLDVSGSNYQINIDGNWSSSGTFEARSSTVTLEGSSGTQTVTSGGQSFYNLVINNTGTSVQLEDDLDVNGNLTISAGTLDTKSGENNPINVAGNWTHEGGTFECRQSTVTFDNASSTSTLTGSTTFYGLVSTASGKLIKFSSSTITYVTGHLDFENITLRSTLDNATWYLNLSGGHDVSNVDVMDSNASGGDTIFAVGSTNSGNNRNWVFLTGNGRYWVGGTGNWSDDTNHWATSSGGSPAGGNKPGANDTAIFDANSGGGTCTINEAVNIKGLLMKNTYSGTISQGANTITIGADNAVFSGGTFTGGTASITVNGNMTISGTAFTSTSGTLQISSNYTLSSGSFVHNSGTIVFSGNSKTITPGSSTYNNVNFSSQWGLITISGTLYVAGNLSSYCSSTSYAITGNIQLNGSGNQTISATNSSGRIGFSGTTMTINKSDGSAVLGTEVYISNLIINNGNTFDVSESNYQLTVGETFTNNGTFNARAGTIVFAGTGKTITPGSSTYNNVNFSNQWGNNTISGTLYVAGNLSSYCSDTSYKITGNIQLNGSGNQTISETYGNGYGFSYTTITINKSGGSALLGSTVYISNLTINADNTFNVAGYNLTAPTFTNNGTLQLQGDETVSTPTNNSGSTVEYTATSGSRAIKNWTYQSLKINGADGTFTLGAGETLGENLTVSTGTFDLNGFALSISSATTIEAGAMKTSTNTVTFGNGTGDDSVSITGGELHIESDDTSSDIVLNLGSGSWSNTGGTIIYDGSTVNTNLLSSLSPYNNLTIDSAGSTYTLNGNITVNGDLTINDGTLNTAANNYAISVGGDWNRAGGTFTVNNSTVTFITASSTSTLTGSTTFYGLVSTASGKNVKVSSDTVIGVTGHLNFENITLRSTLQGATWYLNLSGSGTQDVSGVDVQDSNASGGSTILAYGSTDSGNNTNWTFVDGTPPAAITDLSGQCDSGTGYVTLSWSTPGDDGWNNTLVDGSKYRIDYSTYSIAWSTGTWDVDISTSGVAPHTPVSHTITGLTGDSTYYFRIWTADEIPNWSGLSNGCTVWVNPILSVSISTDTYDFGEVPLGNSTHTVSIITVTNDGNIAEDFGLSCATTTPGGSPWYPGLVGESSDYYNRFILRGVFNATEVATDDFGPEDTIEESIRWSQSTSTFTVTGAYTGVNVDANEGRNIWFRLDLPSTSGTSKDQQITVTITAKEPD